MVLYIQIEAYNRKYEAEAGFKCAGESISF